MPGMQGHLNLCPKSISGLERGFMASLSTQLRFKYGLLGFIHEIFGIIALLCICLGWKKVLLEMPLPESV